MSERKTGPLGDILPPETGETRAANPVTPQEDVENRDNVGMVQPEDYPAAERALASELTGAPKPGRVPGAGEVDEPQDYDRDPKGGGGKFNPENARGAPDKGADAAIHGSR